MNFIIENNKELIARRFADFLVRDISKVLEDKKQYNLVLAGGSTPKLLYKILDSDYRDAVDWSRVHLFFGDERMVPPTHAESNYKMAAESLMAHIDFPSANKHRILGELTPEEACTQYIEELASVDRLDMVLLGMGVDGHTLSIFPHEIELLDADGTCVVATHPNSGQKRVSLSGQLLKTAHNICFLVTGDNKAKRMEEIKNCERSDLRQYLPASQVNIRYPHTRWFMDEPAASLLRN